MSKILYPVGTEVAFKQFDVPRRYKVVKYVKGASKPYRLEGVKDRRQTASAHVSELCKFVNHRYSVNKRRSADDDVATPQRATSGLSRSEVQEIISKEVAVVTSYLDRKVAELHDHMYQDASALAALAVDEHENQEIDETA